MGRQRSVQEPAIPQGRVRPVRQEQAQGMLIEALGMLATHFGSEKERLASSCKSSHQISRARAGLRKCRKSPSLSEATSWLRG
jgi:hypothetical protein